MFFYLLSHILTAWFAFCIPCYSTLKAISHRPLNEPELKRWLMYWTVVGAFVAFEYVAEWLVSWLPFYWETKTLFLLFLALPQTQGSTYVFNSYLYPLFVKHEAELDEKINDVRALAITFLQAQLRKLLDRLPAHMRSSSAAPGLPFPLPLALNYLQALATPNGVVHHPPPMQGRTPSSASQNGSKDRNDAEHHSTPSFPVPYHNE